MTTKMIAITDEDAIKLSATIIEVDATNELVQEAKKQINIAPQVFKVLFDYYMKSLKEHKLLWIEMLNKYVGEDEASLHKNLYRFDIQKKVIFLHRKEDCKLCQIK